MLAVQLVDYLNLAPGDTGICNGLFSQSSQVGWVGVRMREAADERSSGTVRELLASAFLPSTWSRARPWTLEG